MKKTLAAIALVLTLTLSGCGSDAPPDEGKETPSGEGISVSTSGEDPYVTLVEIEGTECILAKTYYGLSIDCNWVVDTPLQ